MIQRSDILSIPYLKKSTFTGSCQGMRYRLEKVEEDENVQLQAVIWDAPYSYAVTAEEKKEYQRFPFSEEGICQVVDWLNEKWQEQEERWRNAKNNW